jgi:DNA topoisomerase IB
MCREETKYDRLQAFAAALPKIRTRTTADLARAGLPREKVLATVVQLLEKSLIRVGNEEYAKANNSFGLTTLKDKHVAVKGRRFGSSSAARAAFATRLMSTIVVSRASSNNAVTCRAGPFSVHR